MKKLFTQAYALGVRYPLPLDEIDYGDMRDKFYKEFPVGYMQQVSDREVVVIIPVGKWESAKEYFIGYDLIENIDIIITNEKS